MNDSLRSYLAEFIGAFSLVFIGTAAVTFHAFFDYGDAGWPAIAAAFGGTLAVLLLVFDPATTGHFNPAVTIPLGLAGRIPPRRVAGCVAAQLAGAAAASAALWTIVVNIPAYDLAAYGLGANLNPQDLAPTGLLGLELLLSALFVFVSFATTQAGTPRLTSAAAIGGFYFLANLVAAPLGGASLNPARSIAPALLSGGDALAVLWIYITGPIVGGLLGWLGHRLVFGNANA